MNSYRRANLHCIILKFMLPALIASILLSACKKADSLLPSVSIQTIEDRFFNSHRSSDITEKQLAAYIERQNASLGFVRKTVKQIGYPYWNKALAVRQKNTNTGGRNPGDSLTLFYIPFVRDSQHYVNASLVISASATDTSFWYYCDWQYLSLSNDSANLQVDKAEQLALLLMRLDKEVFNYKRFEINDSTLFNEGDGRAMMLQLDTTAPGTVSRLNYELYCQDFAVTMYEPCSPREETPATGRTRPMCPVTKWITFCWYELDIGGVGPGSGGTGGGTPNPGGLPPECGSPSEERRGNLPCIVVPGWEPVTDSTYIPEPPPDPCDAFIAALSSNTTFATNFRSLMSAENLAATHERGYLINFVTNQFELKQGQTPVNCTNCRGQVNLGTSSAVSGTLHNHLNGSASMFSPQDVVNQMAKIFIEGKAQDPSNLFCGVATANGPYLLKVVDTARFRKMANKIYSAVNPQLQGNFENDNIHNFNWATDSTKNEGDFLYMLSKFSRQGGLTLYKGNSDCSAWSALSVSSNMQGGQIVYTIYKQNCY